jgi:peptidoglycan/xylan/chitin deacetylase (PgdA/CDA1 family)
MRSVFAVSFLSAFLAAGLAGASQCPHNPSALGTSRVLVVDPAEHMRLGTMQYPETLPLADREVVLTFDDGPLPPYTNRILEMLAAECVKATYFLVGRMASSHPDLARRIYDEGHTVGTHSQNHPFTFHVMSVDRAAREIEDGFTSTRAALGDPNAVAPFFRIPGLLRASGVESYLASRGIMTWSADVPADDWRRISANEVVKRSIQRLEAKGKGILLLHDIQPVTVLALPALLRELKARGFRVVHVVPSMPDRPKTVTEPGQWLLAGARARAKKPWPQVVTPALPEHSRLPIPSPSSFGSAHPYGPKATVPLFSPQSSQTAAVHGPVPLPPLPPWPRVVDPVDVAKDADLPAPGAENFAPDQPKVREAEFPMVLRPSLDPMITGVARRHRAQRRARPAPDTAPAGLLRTIFLQTPPRPPAPLRARLRAAESRPVASRLWP